MVAHGAHLAEPKTIVRKEEWQRWNDYGIGLFLQGDLKGAAAAFQKVTEADPNNPDGWVNIGRCAVQEGDMDRARTVLEKAHCTEPRTWLAPISFMPRFFARTATMKARRRDCEACWHNIRETALRSMIWDASCSCNANTTRR